MTGVGTVSPSGADVATTWKNDSEGRSGGGPSEGAGRRLRGGGTGLCRGDKGAPDHIEDRGGWEARRRRKADEIARRTGRSQRG